MSEGCCDNHPKACVANGLVELIGVLIVGCTFGWRWVGLYFVVAAQTDWLVRVWKHDRRTA